MSNLEKCRRLWHEGCRCGCDVLSTSTYKVEGKTTLEKVVSMTNIIANELKLAPVSLKLCFKAEENLVLNNKNNRVFLPRAYRSDRRVWMGLTDN